MNNIAPSSPLIFPRKILYIYTHTYNIYIYIYIYIYTHVCCCIHSILKMATLTVTTMYVITVADLELSEREGVKFGSVSLKKRVAWWAHPAEAIASIVNFVNFHNHM